MSKAINAIFGPFLQNCRGTFWCLTDWLWTSLVPCTLASFSFHKHSSWAAEAAVSQPWICVQLLKALPRKKLGKTPFCLTLGLFVGTALNSVIWDIFLVIQRAQVFLFSSISVAILLSIPQAWCKAILKQLYLSLPLTKAVRATLTYLVAVNGWLICLL